MIVREDLKGLEKISVKLALGPGLFLFGENALSNTVLAPELVLLGAVFRVRVGDDVSTIAEA